MLKKIFLAVIAAVLTLTGEINQGFAQSADLQDEARARLGQSNSGTQTASGIDRREIYSSIGELTAASVGEHYRAMSGLLTNSDQARLGELKSDQKLSQELSQFAALWKAKYGVPFEYNSIKIANYSFNYQIIGASSDRPVLVKIPAAHALPAVTLRLVHEGEGAHSWRLDVPDEVTADSLISKLTKVMNQLNQRKALWPPNLPSAFRMVSHFVMLALTGRETTA